MGGLPIVSAATGGIASHQARESAAIALRAKRSQFGFLLITLAAVAQLASTLMQWPE